MLHSSMINEGDINNRGTVAGEMGDALLAVDLGVSLDACSVGGRGQGLMPYRMQKNMIVASLRLSGLCHCNVWVHDCVWKQSVALQALAFQIILDYLYYYDHLLSFILIYHRYLVNAVYCLVHPKIVSCQRAMGKNGQYCKLSWNPLIKVFIASQIAAVERDYYLTADAHPKTLML